MADFPALPLWTDAYLADTRHLSQAEHGAYLLLLMEAWRRPRCCLPDDDVLLARLSGSPSVADWQAIKPVVMAFWNRDARACEWTQKRMLKERDFVEKSRRQKRDAARKRWKKTEKSDAVGCEPHMQPTPTPTPTIKEEKIPPDGGSSSASAYRWQGHVIRLKAPDFDRWADSFRYLDLPAELESLDAWLASDDATESNRKRWFHVAAGALKNRNADAKAKGRTTNSATRKRNTLDTPAGESPYADLLRPN